MSQPSSVPRWGHSVCRTQEPGACVGYHSGSGEPLLYHFTFCPRLPAPGPLPHFPGQNLESSPSCCVAPHPAAALRVTPSMQRKWQIPHQLWAEVAFPLRSSLGVWGTWLAVTAEGSPVSGLWGQARGTRKEREAPPYSTVRSLVLPGLRHENGVSPGFGCAHVLSRPRIPGRAGRMGCHAGPLLGLVLCVLHADLRVVSGREAAQGYFSTHSWLERCPRFCAWGRCRLTTGLSPGARHGASYPPTHLPFTRWSPSGLWLHCPSSVLGGSCRAAATQPRSLDAALIPTLWEHAFLGAGFQGALSPSAL